MKKQYIAGLLVLTVAAMLLSGCHKKEPESKPSAAESANQLEPQEPQTIEQQPQEATQCEFEGQKKPYMSQLTPVSKTISTTAMRNHGGIGVEKVDLSQTLVFEEEADIVFQPEIGGFKLVNVGILDVFSNPQKRPISLCYDSDALNSSVCILVEHIPQTVTGEQMDLAFCQNKMQERIMQFSMGKRVLHDINDKELTHDIALAAKHKGSNTAINGLQFNEPSPEVKLAASRLPFRSISWSWQIANGYTERYVVNDKGLHGAEMLWNQKRNFQVRGHGTTQHAENQSVEQHYELTSFIILKNTRLLTVIVQSEGDEAQENNRNAVESFMASFDADVLSYPCREFYDRQDEKYEKSGWHELVKKPLPIYATLKKDAPQELIDACITREEMRGKLFRDICGVDYDTKLNYSRCDHQSRLADARQNLILYIGEYASLGPSLCQPLGIIFKGANGYVDADTLIGEFHPKACPEEADMPSRELVLRERMLRDKILFRVRQVQRLTRIIANDKQRRLNAVEREIDSKRTAELEAYIRQSVSNIQNQNGENPSDRSKQAVNAINHIMDELKSGAVSTRLNADSYQSGNSTISESISQIAIRANLPIASLKADLAKTLFDLGDDQFALQILPNHGYGYNNGEDYLSYILANGLDVYKTNPALLNNQTEWYKTLRMSHLMAVSNYPMPSDVICTLIAKGKNDIAGALLIADATVNKRSSNGQLPLSIAIMTGNSEIEQMLLANGADRNLTDFGEKCPEDYRIYGTYWNALISKDYQTQKECLAKGMDVNITLPNTSARYIDTALEKRDMEAARMLLEAGADPSFNKILFRAYQYGQLEFFKLLLKHGAPIEHNGHNYLCDLLKHNYSTQNYSTEFLKEILSRLGKTKINDEICYNNQFDGGFGQNFWKLTPASYAIYSSTRHYNGADQLLKKLKVLEEAGADITKMPSPNSLNPFFFVALRQHSSVEIYSYLLSKGLDVNSVAVPKSTKFYIDEWKMPNEISTKGVEKTGLLTYMARQWATTKFMPQDVILNVIPYLAEKGAKAYIKDSYGKSCIDYVEEMIVKETPQSKLLKSKLTQLGLM